MNKYDGTYLPHVPDIRTCPWLLIHLATSVYTLLFLQLYERCRHATASIIPSDLKQHMQKLSHHLKSGSDVDYALLEEPDFWYQRGCRDLLFLYKHIRGTESP